MAPKFIIRNEDINIPLTVPIDMKEHFCSSYKRATRGSGRLFLFAADHKVEHLNKDFYGSGVHKDASRPEHLFEIAEKGSVGAFATQLGLIARYASKYKNIRYVVKLNSKTNLLPQAQHDPFSAHWVTVDQVVALKQQASLDIVGVGITIYLGSEHEAAMLSQAAQAIYQAHMHGLLAVVWMYPRGRSVKDERSIDVIAGAAGVATCLGADFVKVHPPEADDDYSSAQKLCQATDAAGNTKIICSGGSYQQSRNVLQAVYHQIHVGGACGAAIGRNIYQKSTTDAIVFCKALSALIVDDVDVESAIKLL